MSLNWPGISLSLSASLLPELSESSLTRVKPEETDYGVDIRESNIGMFLMLSSNFYRRIKSFRASQYRGFASNT
jgi:hypothetical protein